MSYQTDDVWNNNNDGLCFEVFLKFFKYSLYKFMMYLFTEIGHVWEPKSADMKTTAWMMTMIFDDFSYLLVHASWCYLFKVELCLFVCFFFTVWINDDKEIMKHH